MIMEDHPIQWSILRPQPLRQFNLIFYFSKLFPQAYWSGLEATGAEWSYYPQSGTERSLLDTDVHPHCTDEKIQVQTD